MAKKKVKKEKKVVVSPAPPKRVVTVDDLIAINEKIIENDYRLEQRINRIVAAIDTSRPVRGL